MRGSSQILGAHGINHPITYIFGHEDNLMYFILKVFIPALVVTGVSELARRYNLIAAALASLPLTSILAFIWLYHDTYDLKKVSELSYSIMWLVIPSLLFFVMFPLLIKLGFKFYPAIIISCIVMSAGYALSIYLKKIFLG